MGQKLVPREVDPFLHDLGRWMDFRGVTYEDLAAAWGKTRTPAYERLSGKQDVGFRQLRKALKVLGVSLEDFVRGVRTGFHPELLLGEIEGEDSEQVRNFQRLHLHSPPQRAYSAEELREMAESLETLRFRRPEEAWRLAREILRSPDLDADVAAEAWGILAVLSRFKGRPSITAFCLGQTLRIGGSLSTRGRNWTRFGMLLLYHVRDPQLALEAIGRAWNCYKQGGDVAGLGKTMVDEGLIHLNGTGDYRQALIAYEAALGVLPEDLIVYRFCALQGAAVTCVYLRNVDRAYECLDQALAVVVVEHAGIFLASTIFWLKGEIALLLGQYSEAITHFSSVKKRYVELEMGPVEIALVSLRIAKAHFLLGDRRRVRRVLEDVLFRLGDVERANRLLGVALGEFLRETARGGVTAELLEEIYRTMHGGAESAPPLLPSELSAAE